MIPNAFADLKNSFLKFDIHSAGESKFDNSAYCLFEKIVVSSKNIVFLDVFRLFLGNRSTTRQRHNRSRTFGFTKIFQVSAVVMSS